MSLNWQASSLFLWGRASYVRTVWMAASRCRASSIPFPGATLRCTCMQRRNLHCPDTSTCRCSKPFYEMLSNTRMRSLTGSRFAFPFFDSCERIGAWWMHLSSQVLQDLFGSGGKPGGPSRVTEYQTRYGQVAKQVADKRELTK
jgi:hypothetical protein